MGMVDTVTCEVEVPGLGVPEGISFATKNLYRHGAHFTITRQGRLVEYGRYRDPKSIRDVDYHGDIRFDGGRVGESLEYVARFTHGQLEWLRSAADLPEEYLQALRLRD
jgi:hypothetical protein